MNDFIEETPKPRLDEKGHEIPDQTPVALPLGFKRPETIQESIQRMVRSHVSEIAQNEGFETFEDADDFEIEDEDTDPSTPFEMEFDPILGKEVSPEMLKDPRYREQYVEAALDHPETEERLDTAQRKAAYKKRPQTGPESPPQTEGGSDPVDTPETPQQ